MFVPRAHVHLSNPDSKRLWFSRRPSRRNVIQRKLKWYECVRMPCLMPTLVGTAIGVLILISGTLMSFIGYNPRAFLGIPEEDHTNRFRSNVTDTTAVSVEGLKVLAYVGPVFMGVGFFVMIIAVVLYCEIKEKYVCNILPQQNVNVKQVQKDVLYDMIIDEFRKNYFRGIQVPIQKRTKRQKSVEERYPTLFKALSISTPALIITPEIQRKWKNSCEASPNPSRSRRKKYIYDTWLKTSSLPNIRARAGQRQALRNERRVHRRAVFQDRLSKSCDHHDMQSKSVDTDKDDRGSCFDNPAYRTSPPQEKLPPQIQVSPPSTPDTLEVDLTNISVQVDYHEIPNGKIIHSVSCNTTDDSCRTFSSGHISSSRSFTSDLSRSDTRGLTMKRRLYPQSCIDLCDEESSDKHVLVTLDNVTAQKNLQCQTQLRSGKRGMFIRNSKPGPYKTLIGVFRSESCLDRIKKFTKPNSDKDNDSLDSFTLTEDVLKNFEMAELS
ncbi:uncharacterized protein LOC134234609 [Saccostrea cucullata]|uniref:uncharacterized protein LOC134234609 n=1 Tax=Saccostrea cuccullata TaxID=36930 RepID=UPI002ED25F24